MTISKTLRPRLSKEREMTSITLRIPVDVVESMKAIAPLRGMAGYQSLLKSYLSDGLRRDEAQFVFGPLGPVLDVLRRHNIPQDIIDEVARGAELARNPEPA